jgi:S1-C subfamily serine protease
MTAHYVNYILLFSSGSSGLRQADYCAEHCPPNLTSLRPAGQTIDQGIAQLLKLPVTQGVLVAHVQNGTAAAKAGVKGGSKTVDIQGAPFVTGGDIITKLDGQPLTSMDQLAAAIAEKQPGQQVTLTLLRNGSNQDVTLALGDRPARQ